MSILALQHRLAEGLIVVLLFLFALLQLFPLVWLVDFSLLKSGDFFGSEVLKWPDPPQFQNYVIAWERGRIPLFLLNSLLVCGVSVAVTLYLALTLSYALKRLQWRLSKFFLIVILLGMMIPIHTTLLPNFIVFSLLGIRDNYFSLIIPYVAFSMPLAVFIMTGFLESVPKSLDESAIIDGCGYFAVVFKIIMPVTKPALVTIMILTFISCWNEFIMAATYLSNEDLKTLPFAIYKFTNQFGADYSLQFAVMVMGTIPSLALYFIFNKQIIKGIMVGAVKG